MTIRTILKSILIAEPAVVPTDPWIMQLIGIEQSNPGGPGLDTYAKCIVTDSTGCSYVSGYANGFSQSVGTYVSKLSATGAVLWCYCMDDNSGNSDPFEITLSPDETVLCIQGTYFNSSSESSNSFLILIHSTTGAEIWKKYQTSWYRQGSVRFDSNNNIIWCSRQNYAFMVSSLSLSGEELWGYEFEAKFGASIRFPRIMVDNNDNVLIALIVDWSALSIIKIAQTGDVLWSYSATPEIGPGVETEYLGLTINANNEIYACCTFLGSGLKTLLIKLDTQGSVLWRKTFPTLACSQILFNNFDNMLYMLTMVNGDINLLTIDSIGDILSATGLSPSHNSILSFDGNVLTSDPLGNVYFVWSATIQHSVNPIGTVGATTMAAKNLHKAQYGTYSIDEYTFDIYRILPGDELAQGVDDAGNYDNLDVNMWTLALVYYDLDFVYAIFENINNVLELPKK